MGGRTQTGNELLSKIYFRVKAKIPLIHHNITSTLHQIRLNSSLILEIEVVRFAYFRADLISERSELETIFCHGVILESSRDRLRYLLLASLEPS